MKGFEFTEEWVDAGNWRILVLYGKNQSYLTITRSIVPININPTNDEHPSISK